MENTTAEINNKWNQYLIEFCSPTLAGIKSGSLFRIKYSGEEELTKAICLLNKSCITKGVYFVILNKKNNFALIYVFRKDMLAGALCEDRNWNLLETYGYKSKGTRDILGHLRKRICEADGFPHEIGIFLGYPYEDVKGFIDNTGKDYKVCGYWKVYGDACNAKKIFEKYDFCTECYKKCYQNGMTLSELTVAV